MRTLFAFVVVIQFLLAFTQDLQGQTPQPERTPAPIQLGTPMPGETVYEIISRTPELSEFADLIDQTGFRVFLDIPFSRVTVFAPTNEAFQMFREQQGEESGDQAQNFQTVAYHIGTPSRELSSFEDNELFFTAGGLPVRINRYEDVMAVTVNGALVQGEASATNGEIVVVDQVLTPPNGTLYQILQEREDFSMFAELVRDSNQDIVNRLQDPSATLTIFVPSNQALEGQTEELQDQQQISDFVQRFISDQVLYSISLFDGREIQTESGQNFNIAIEGNSLRLGDAPIREVDINAINGVAHVLDQLPSMETPMPETPKSQ